MKLCLKLCSSMFIIGDVKPIGPGVAPLAVFTSSFFFTIFTLIDIFIKSWYKIQEQVPPVSNTASMGSQFCSLTSKFDNFSLAYSRFDTVCMF